MDDGRRIIRAIKEHGSRRAWTVRLGSGLAGAGTLLTSHTDWTAFDTPGNEDGGAAYEDAPGMRAWRRHT